MANKKRASRASAIAPKTFLEKIGEKASHLKEELIAGKDHLAEIASEKLASVKSSIKEYQARKATPVKKKAAKKAISKKGAKKKTGKSVSSTAKRSSSSPSKPGSKKVKKAATKKKSSKK